ncbi:NlpC/P60 family protein [Clostridium ganghwense]|uniref:NlpC/P60 family protein n=1 Tax=Clostridium ganghwense TaxID=312089 RepID=A0ABT4CMH7_9CLOT|nr:C40 family peptidase [Clostridium ganghwense]MCY6370242.1 NlpC/P60 family protein [Clostridium ganghwense]
MNKRLIVLVTAVLLLVSMNTTVVLSQPSSDKDKTNQKQLQQHRIEYNNVYKKAEQFEQAVEYLDNEIETKMQEIEINNKKIEDIKNKIELVEKDIQKAEDDIAAEKKLYNKRMRVMYMHGTGGGYIDIIFGSKDLNDLFSRIQTIKKITELDKKIVKELKDNQDGIKAKKEELTKKKNELVALNSEQQEKIEKLKNDKEEQSKLIEETKKQTILYGNILSDDEKQINETKKIIEEIREKVSMDKPSRGLLAISSNAIVTYASDYLGTPYVWAANGPDSFDCSGFVKYVYAHFGIELPRCSSAQAAVGTYVEKENLQPGDLVFFANDGGEGTIHHVGIYVGNGCYIHAPRTGDVVKISSLDVRTDYATARRVGKYIKNN